jgi:hypothetical protein
MPQVKKPATKKPTSNKKIPATKRVMRKITEIEKLNYFLYLIIVIVTGFVFFSVSYFTTQKIVEVANFNEVDRSFELLNVSAGGVDVSVKSRDEVKIRYYLGTSPETLVLFSEIDKYVREDYSQFRFTVNGKTYFLQVEFEKMDGTRTKSRIVEIK